MELREKHLNFGHYNESDFYCNTQSLGVFPKGIWKNVPILQVGGPAPAPPKLPVIRVVLPHTEACDQTLLLQPHCTSQKNGTYSLVPELKCWPLTLNVMINVLIIGQPPVTAIIRWRFTVMDPISGTTLLKSLPVTIRITARKMIFKSHYPSFNESLCQFLKFL